MEPRGRAGWLAFFIFMLIASTLTVTSKSLGPIFEAESLGAVWPSGFKVVYLASVLLPAGVLGFAAWMLITHSDWFAVIIAIRSMWAGALGSIVAPTLVLNSYLPDINAPKEALLPTFSTLIWLSIWTFYLLKSKRVKNTYSIGAPSFIEKLQPLESSLQNIFEAPLPSQTQSIPPIKQSPANTILKTESGKEIESLKFTIFRSDADGKWYWILQNSISTIARSSGKLSRSECLKDIDQICSCSPNTPIWDKTSNEYARH